MSLPEIVLSHSGSNTQAYRIFAALRALGYPARFETGFYYMRGSVLARLAEALPAALGGSLKRELMRRFDPEVESAHVRIHPWMEIAYIALKRLGIPERRLARIILWRDAAFDRHVARRIASAPPRIVIAHDGQALATIRAARRLGTISVLNQVTGHVLKALTTYREEAELCPDFADSLSTHLPLEIGEAMRPESIEADWILAPSEYVRDSLVEYGTDPARIAMLPYGVDIERFAPGPPRAAEAPFRILFVGQIGQKKGIKYLLEAVRRLALPNVELVLAGLVIGGGSGLKPYRNLFRHIAHVPHHEVHRLYRNADIFVFPSLHEGSAFANLEAMASGLPVITTPNAGSLVEDGREGFIVPMRDTEALMERIARLYRDRALLDQMGAAARAKAEANTWHDHRARLASWLRRFDARRPQSTERK